MDPKTLKSVFKKYRWVVITGVASLAVMLVLLVTGIIFASVQAIKSLQANDDWKKSASEIVTAVDDTNFFTDLALGVSQYTLAESLRRGDLVSVVDGVACINSMGGPTPKVLLEHLKRNMTNVDLASQLVEVEQAMESGIKGRSSGHCLNWLLNS
jgi:hypothetical protein